MTILWSLLTSKLILLIQTENTCTLEHYYLCQNNIKIDSDIAVLFCKSACVDLCERKLFNILQRQTDQELYDIAHLIISIKGLQYPVFEEELKWNRETFLGALGGIIGFFLGLSFFQIVMSIYTFFVMVYKKYRLIKDGKNENSTAEINEGVSERPLMTVSSDQQQTERNGWSLTGLTKRAKRWRWKQVTLHTTQSERLKIFKWLSSNLFKVTITIWTSFLKYSNLYKMTLNIVS